MFTLCICSPCVCSSSMNLSTIFYARTIIILTLEVLEFQVPLVMKPNFVQTYQNATSTASGYGASDYPAPAPTANSYGASAYPAQAPTASGYGASAYPTPAPTASGYGASAYPTQAPTASSWTGGYGSSGSASMYNSKPVVREDSSAQVTPIRALNPYSNRWTIKARVTHKSEKKSWKNAKGEGTLFSIDLIDQDKTEIRGTFFKQACEEFFPKIAQGSVYYFSGGKLKPVQNRQFTNIVNDYEITFDQTSIISPASDDSDIAADSYNFVKISQIAQLEPNTTVDIIGLVKDAGNVGTIVSAKQGNKEIFKRDLTVVDDSSTEIRLTLWGNQAKDETFPWDSRPVVAFKGCKIGDYGGRTLSLMNNGSITVAPRVPEGDMLVRWVQSQGGDVKNIHSSSISNGGGVAGGSKDTFETRKYCCSIKNEDMGRGDKPDWVSMKLSLVYAKVDTDPWYTACSRPDCKKKVTENVSNRTYFCEKCQTSMDYCIRRYVLNTQMGDHTGSEWFSFFDDQAKQLLGKSADEMDTIKREQGDQVFRDVVNQALFKQFIVKAKVKYEDVQGESRRKCSVFQLDNIDYRTECAKMIEAINKYQ